MLETEKCVGAFRMRLQTMVDFSTTYYKGNAKLTDDLDD